MASVVPWSGAIALHDPARGEPVDGEVAGRFEGHCPAEAVPLLERELRLAVMDVLHFGGGDLQARARDLATLSQDVTAKTQAALEELGAVGTAAIERLELDVPDPVADWGAETSPKWAGAFTVLDTQSKLTLTGQATGRFAGAPPADPTSLATIVVAALARVLAGVPSVVNAFDDIAALNQLVTDAALPQLEPLNSFGFVVIESARYDDDAERALLAWHEQRKQGVAEATGRAVKVIWSDGQRYPGVVVKEGGGQYLVRLENGQEVWLGPAYVVFDEQG